MNNQGSRGRRGGALDAARTSTPASARTSARDAAGRLPGWLLVTIAVFSVQFGNAIGGSLFGFVGPLGAACLRLLFAASILLIVVRPKVRGWGKQQWIGAAALGLAMAGMNACIYIAIDHIPIGIAVTIELLGPISVAAFGMKRAIDAVWVLLAVTGIVILGSGIGGGSGDGVLEGLGTLPLVGVVAALAAAACWALYILTAARLGAHVRGVDGLAIALAIGAIALLPFGAAPAASGVVDAPWLLLAFAGLALITSVIPYGLEFIALKRMPPRVFGVLSSLGPAVAVLAGFVILGQGLSLTQFGAIILVVIASAGAVAVASRGA